MFSAKPARRRALISLTPLIDVVFILLVFFMLASSFLDWRAIDLSAPASGDRAMSSKGAMQVDILTDGLRLGTKRLSLDEVAQRIGSRLEVEPDQRVIVRSAAGVPLQRAIDVLDRLTAAGAHRLSLVPAGQ